MLVSTSRAVLCALAGALLVACGSGPDAGDPTPAQLDEPAAPAPPVAAPAPKEADVAATYPAFRPEMPQLVSKGGKVLASPKFALIHFADDARTAVAESFVAKVGKSSYWSDVTKEYGVGTATALAPVTIGEAPPATLDDAEIRTWLAAQLDGTHPEVPVPDERTVYVMVYPQGTSLTRGGTKGCVDVLGYHDEAPIAAGRSVPYVVVPYCSGGSYTDEEALTIVLSHELVEASVNPFPRTAPAYDSVDEAHTAWLTTFTDDEPADFCAPYNTRPADLDYLVQRVWSNASAKAGHHPCVPADATPYFAAVPVLSDTFAGTAIPSVAIPVGESRTIDLQLFSEGPTADFTVVVYDLASLNGGAPQLSFSLDRSKGHNGDVLKLTITAVTAGSVNKAKGVSSFLVVAKSKTTASYWPAFVMN